MEAVVPAVAPGVLNKKESISELFYFNHNLHEY